MDGGNVALTEAGDTLEGPIFELLDRLLEHAPKLEVSDSDRIVIFSDLHMGDGGKGDDFRRNAAFFRTLLERCYLPQGYTLVLNGDVEELQKFSLHQVVSRWGELYELFGAFGREGRLYKIAGNHDESLIWDEPHRVVSSTLPALRLIHRGDTILVFHGHQASYLMNYFQKVLVFLLRYLAHPLGFHSYSISRNSRRQYRVERRVYRFSASRKIVSIIGHTHRPLFESLSRVDNLRFRIERLCRRYPQAPPQEQERLARRIRRSKEQVERWYRSNPREAQLSSLYNSRLAVPCVFNSGCTIGKHGITGIEIADGRIALVHWFDGSRSRRPPAARAVRSQRLGDSRYYKVVLNRDSLSYVFTRIRLLA